MRDLRRDHDHALLQVVEAAAVLYRAVQHEVHGAGVAAIDVIESARLQHDADGHERRRVQAATPYTQSDCQRVTGTAAAHLLHHKHLRPQLQQRVPTPPVSATNNAGPRFEETLNC